MYLVASKYNNELFHVKINTCLRYRFVVRCESTTCLFDKLGKKYIELRILDPTFQAVVVDIFDLMNTKFNTNISPTPIFLAKIPFRYGKFEIQVSGTNGFWLTTDDIKSDQTMDVDLELSSVYNFGIHWIVKRISIL